MKIMKNKNTEHEKIAKRDALETAAKNVPALKKKRKDE